MDGRSDPIGKSQSSLAKGQEFQSQPCQPMTYKNNVYVLLLSLVLSINGTVQRLVSSVSE